VPLWVEKAKVRCRHSFSSVIREVVAPG
jgi:hypothetical protein